MPIEKRSGETRDEYISRCIEVEIGSGKDNDQAVAICINKADEMFITDILNGDSEPEDKLEMLYTFFKWRSKPNSSNVKNIMYNDETKELVIQFNSGDIYTYSNIDFSQFQRVFSGAGICRTEGKNKWGSWFVGKTPSVGAAVYQTLVRSGASYRRGGSLR
jgi:hypothetical protein